MTDYERVAIERLSIEEKPSEFDRLDDLDPARGIIFGVLAGIALVVWVYYAGVWRWFQ